MNGHTLGRVNADPGAMMRMASFDRLPLSTRHALNYAAANIPPIEVEAAMRQHGIPQDELTALVLETDRLLVQRAQEEYIHG